MTDTEPPPTWAEVAALLAACRTRARAAAFAEGRDEGRRDVLKSLGACNGSAPAVLSFIKSVYDDEHGVKRDHGRFSSTGGASDGNAGGVSATDGSPPGGDGANRPVRERGAGGGVDSSAEHPADAAARTLAARIADVPAHLARRVSEWVGAKYKRLSDRYGETGAKAILGAMVLLTPVPLPGTSLLPVAVAEAVLRIRSVVLQKAAGGELSDEQVTALARDLWHELHEEMGEAFDGETVVKGWEEGKHPRDHGKFSSTPGESGGGKGKKNRAKPEPAEPQAEAAVPSVAPVPHTDAHGETKRYGDAVALDGNWGRLRDMPAEQPVALFHATSQDAAAEILRNGFDAKSAKTRFSDSDPNYAYLGDEDGLGAYLGYQGGSKPALIVVRVKKGDLEPDKGADWKSRVKQDRKAIKKRGIDPDDPTAVDTFAEINQVRAHNSAVEPIGVILPDDRGHMKRFVSKEEFLAGTEKKAVDPDPPADDDDSADSSPDDTDTWTPDVVLLAMLTDVLDAAEHGGDAEAAAEKYRGAIDAMGGGRIEKAARHAPAGGVSVGGKQFHGGQFIPAEVMANATDAEKADLAAKDDAAAADKPKTHKQQRAEGVAARRKQKHETKARADELIGKLHADVLHAREFSADDLHALADHLPHMTVADLKRARLWLSANFKGDTRRAQMVERLREYVKGATAEPGATEVARPAEVGDNAAIPKEEPAVPPEAAPHPASVPVEYPEVHGTDPISESVRDQTRRSALAKKLATAGALLPDEARDFAESPSYAPGQPMTASRAEVLLTNKLGVPPDEAKRMLAGLKPDGTATVAGNRKRPTYAVLDLFRAAGKLYENPRNETAPGDKTGVEASRSGSPATGNDDGRGQSLLREVPRGPGDGRGPAVGPGDGRGAGGVGARVGGDVGRAPGGAGRPAVADDRDRQRDLQADEGARGRGQERPVDSGGGAAPAVLPPAQRLDGGVPADRVPVGGDGLAPAKKPRAARKPKAAVAAVRALATAETDPAAKDYLESALHNHDGTPADLAGQLGSSLETRYHTAAGKLGERAVPPAADAAVRRALAALGAAESGPEPGAETGWDPLLHQPPDGESHFTGDPVRVVTRPVLLGGKVVSRGKVAPAGEPGKPTAPAELKTELYKLSAMGGGRDSNPRRFSGKDTAPDVLNTIQDAIARAGGSPSAPRPKLTDLYQAAKTADPGLTPQAFQEAMYRLQVDGRITLGAWTQNPASMPDEMVGTAMPLDGDTKVYAEGRNLEPYSGAGPSSSKRPAGG